jgi:ERCC4-type nuclease
MGNPKDKTATIRSDMTETSVTLQVDYRERAVLDALTPGPTTYMVKGKSHPLPVESVTLHVADFHILRDGKPALFVERKTVADMVASISTGRYREQKARLLRAASETAGCKVVYLVEGPMDGSTLFMSAATGGTSIDMMRKLLVRASVKDGCYIVNTMSANETAAMLTYMAALVHEFGFTTDGTEAAAVTAHKDYPALVRTEKKANMTPPIMQQCMLRVVPGVSDKIAHVLLAKFDGLLGLVEALKVDRNAVAAVEYETGDKGKKRKIGPALGGRIADAVLFTSPSSL